MAKTTFNLKDNIYLVMITVNRINRITKAKKNLLHRKFRSCTFSYKMQIP